MIDLPKHRMTADEFLAWTEDVPKEAGIFELWDGEVVVRHGPGFEEGGSRSTGTGRAPCLSRCGTR